jgi:hypothetical protein
MVDIGTSLFGGHKWVNSMHVVIGPILSLIAFLAYELCFNNSFEGYRELIKGLLIAQIVTGIVVALYHSYRLAQRNDWL